VALFFCYKKKPLILLSSNKTDASEPLNPITICAGMVNGSVLVFFTEKICIKLHSKKMSLQIWHFPGLNFINVPRTAFFPERVKRY
jgi:hypothetical protein